MRAKTRISARMMGEYQCERERGSEAEVEGESQVCESVMRIKARLSMGMRVRVSLRLGV